jgi:transcriptional regulator with XRE-family HTH domain
MPPTPTVRVNGAAIRAFREARGYKVAELASRVEVTSGALRNVELENKLPSVVLANRIARELIIDLAAILRDPERPGERQLPRCL